MKKLRLLLTDKCNRNCAGCCNKDWDLSALPVESLENLSQYDCIMLTGGEPLLNPERVIAVSIIARMEGFTGQIYLYTAMSQPITSILSVMGFIDGVTFTIHKKTDVFEFYDMNARLRYYDNIKSKSLRLNVFKGVELVDFECGDRDRLWSIKKDMEWIKNCPLPKDEVFKRWRQ